VILPGINCRADHNFDNKISQIDGIKQNHMAAWLVKLQNYTDTKA
jgi:hypothetical protein